MATKNAFPPGELLRKINDKGHTQASFAYIADVSMATIFRACQGNELSPRIYRKIATALTNVQRVQAS